MEIQAFQAYNPQRLLYPLGGTELTADELVARQVVAVLRGPSPKARALKLCRGCYQRSLVERGETLGGSTLRGKARQYKGRYQESARSLLDRLDKAGVPYDVKLGPRGGYHCARLILQDW